MTTSDLRAARWPIVVACFLLWFVSSISLLTKYLGVAPSFVAGLAALAAIAGTTRWISELDPRQRAAVSTRSFLFLWLAGVALFAGLYPLSHAGLVGPGSDRDDGLNRALHALLHGEYPYYVRSYLGNPVSELPGAFLFAAPFYLPGGVALQNPFWLGIFFWMCARLFNDKSLALFYVGLFFFASPAALDDFVVGGDWIVNAMYVAVAVGLSLWTLAQTKSWRADLLAATFLGVALSARPIYAVAIPALGAFAWQKRGLASAAGFCAIAGATSLAVVLPFYLYDPGNFTPIAVIMGKLRTFPEALKPAIAVPVLGLAVSCVGFFKRLECIDVYGVIAVSLVPVLFLPWLFAILMHGWSAGVLLPLADATPAAIFGGIWLINQLDDAKRRQDQFAPSHPAAAATPQTPSRR